MLPWQYGIRQGPLLTNRLARWDNIVSSAFSQQQQQQQHGRRICSSKRATLARRDQRAAFRSESGGVLSDRSFLSSVKSHGDLHEKATHAFRHPSLVDYAGRPCHLRQLSTSRSVYLSSKQYDEKGGELCKGQADEKAKSKAQDGPLKLSEDILTIPNVLTIARLLSTPVLGWCIIHGEMGYALALLAASGFTDVLDGYLARRYGSATVFGSIADPAADKALMTVMVGALAWRGLIPVPLVVLIVGRDLGLVFSAFVIRWQSLPAPRTLSRYWDPRLPSARVQPTQVSKYNTFLQLLLVGICTLLASANESWRTWWSSRQGLWKDEAVAPLNGAEKHGCQPDKDWGDLAKKAWHSFMLLVAATTVWSGASYMFGSGAVRYVGRMARERKATGSRK